MGLFSFIFSVKLFAKLTVPIMREKDTNLLSSGSTEREDLRRNVRNGVGTLIEIQKPSSKFLSPFLFCFYTFERRYIMANQFSFVTEAVGFGAEFNRERALRKCVIDCPRLWDAWHEYAREFSDYEEWSPSEWADHIKVFIREKNIRIASEKPFVRIVDGQYTINIIYVIEW